MTERRCRARKSLDAQIAVLYSGLGLLRCRVRDVSIGGVFIETGPILLPHGAVLEVLFDAAGPYRFDAEVVRVASDGVGVAFRRAGTPGIRALQNLLHGEAELDLPQA